MADLVFAERLFTGDEMVANALISIEDGLISSIDILRNGQEPPDPAKRAPIVAPGFIDIQINGGCDLQFTDVPTLECVRAIADAARCGGTAHVLPTFTTAPGTKYLKALAAVSSAIQANEPGILGMHLEGPFLSPKRPGIHDPNNIRPVTSQDVENLVAFKDGKLLVTLAPEAQDEGIVQSLCDQGVITFAGHSDATAQDIHRAQQSGLSGATHLFNAMSQTTGRAPGVVGSVLASDTLFAGIIADGHHVSWENVKIASRVMPDRLCLVTDAMQTLEGELAEFHIHGKTVRLVEGRIADDYGTLAGAHVHMDQCVQNMIHHVGTDPEIALKMASKNPASALGLSHELGRVAEGFRASLTLLRSDYSACGVIVDGDHFGASKSILS